MSNEENLTLTQKMETNGNTLFLCENCGNIFKTKSGLWKHKKTQCFETDSKNGNFRKPKFSESFSCEKCKKTNKSRSGLWKHSRTCKKSENAVVNTKNNTNIVSQEMVVSLIQQNKEMQELLIEQQKHHQEEMHEKQKQIFEMIPKLGNNNTTNKFNINLFLTEKCKDAINIGDFISSLQLTLDDFQMTKDKGLLESVNHQIIKELRRMEIYKRPIHCTDVKRDVMYIKDNDQWEKDENNHKLKSVLGNIAEKQIQNIDIWEKANPTYQETQKGMEDYINIISSISQDIDNESKATNKVIKNISKEVSLNDKDNLIDFIGLSKKMNFASDMNFKFNDKDDSIEGMGDSANAFLDTYKNTYNQVLNSFDAKVLYNIDKSSTKLSSIINPQEIKNITEDILLKRESILTTGDKGVTSAITKNRQVMTTLPLSVVDMNNQALINGEKINIDIFNSNNAYQKFLKDKAESIYGTSEGDEGIRNIIKIQGFIERDKNNTLQITNELKNLLTPVSDKKDKSNIEENDNDTNVVTNTVAPDKVANEIEDNQGKSNIILLPDGTGISDGKKKLTWEQLEKTKQTKNLKGKEKIAYDTWKAKQISKSDTTVNDNADTVFSNMVNKIEADITGS